MRASIEIKGQKELDSYLKRIKKEEPKKLDRVLSALATQTRTEAIDSIQQSPATGRTYKRRSVTHTASSPGNPPRTDTGNLVKNITMQRRAQSDYNVGSRRGAPYGYWLEFGTRNIAKRPWLKPAFEKTIKKLESMLR